MVVLSLFWSVFLECLRYPIMAQKWKHECVFLGLECKVLFTTVVLPGGIGGSVNPLMDGFPRRSSRPQRPRDEMEAWSWS
jgi:hypothetical protein